MDFSGDSISVRCKNLLDSSEIINNDHSVIWFGVEVLTITQFSVICYSDG